MYVAEDNIKWTKQSSTLWWGTKNFGEKTEELAMTLDFDNLNKMVEEGFISKRKHPSLDLYIYNYTPKTQYSHNWNNETMQCRGLIMDGNNNIIARPFPKFFNLSEILGQGGQIPAEDFIVTEKMDGSLGILYQDSDGEYSLATRGSFTSEQAIRGTKILRAKGINWRHHDIPDWTYLFEIIYPENRIVVDYGNAEDIVLLTVRDTFTNFELPYPELLEMAKNEGLSVVEKFDGINDFENLESRPNSEGYVVYFPSSAQRFKVKFDEYVRLHRLITGVNKKTIWELLMNHQNVEELLDRVPDEFYNWVQESIADLQGSYHAIELSARNKFEELDYLKGDRKSFAMVAKDHPYNAILFRMLDNKSYEEVIWKLVRPAAEIPFRTESEDAN